tara:strand:+ start:666 stop:806 length:141 start_codon:yes stop_codon:yes gene_type:complete
MQLWACLQSGEADGGDEGTIRHSLINKAFIDIIGIYTWVLSDLRNI